VLAVLGIALAVQVHVDYTMFGIGLLIAHSPLLFSAIKIAGAGYLILIGWRTFANPIKLSIDLHGEQSASPLSMLGNGFLTNVLNPKTTLFVVSTYTQAVNPQTPLSTRFGYGLFMSATHFSGLHWLQHWSLKRICVHACCIINPVSTSSSAQY